MQTDIRLLSLEPTITDATLRTPLKFGTGVVHTATSCEVRAQVENRRG